MAENFPNIKKDTSRYRSYRAPNKMNPKRPTQRNIIIKTAEVKENFKGSERKAKRHVQWKTRLFVYFGWFFLKGQQGVA